MTADSMRNYILCRQAHMESKNCPRVVIGDHLGVTMISGTGSRYAQSRGDVF